MPTSRPLRCLHPPLCSRSTAHSSRRCHLHRELDDPRPGWDLHQNPYNLINMWEFLRAGSFDLETSGVDPETAFIVTGSLITVSNRGATRVNWLSQPAGEIPVEASALHKVTTEMARQAGQPRGEVIADMVTAVEGIWLSGNPLIVYNAPYDLTLLDREARRELGRGLDVLGPVIDPLVLDRQLDPYRPGSRKLAVSCTAYGVSNDAAHSADSDAVATARLIWALARWYRGEVGGRQLGRLHRWQQFWYRGWATRYQEYLRGQEGGDPTVTISTAWPLVPYLPPSAVNQTCELNATLLV